MRESIFAKGPHDIAANYKSDIFARHEHDIAATHKQDIFARSICDNIAAPEWAKRGCK
jgi:hypothetical protein